MDTTLTIAIASALLPIVASILAVKGSPKWRTAYLRFLYLSLGLMAGLFINHVVSALKGELREVPVVPPTLLAIGGSLQLAEGARLKYERYETSTAIRYFSVHAKGKTKYLTFVVAGQRKGCSVDGDEYIIELIASYPMQDDAVRVAANRLEEH